MPRYRVTLCYVLDLWLFVVVIGASARLTRLVTADSITTFARTAFLRRFKGEVAARTAAEFITCPWCVGFWVALSVTLSAYAWGDQLWFIVATTALTVAHVVGLLARLDRGA